MDSSYIKPPKTMLEVYENLPEGTLAQLINNHIYMSPAPTPTHQIVLIEIATQLFSFVKANNLGKVLPSPIDVYLNRKSAYQPDIIFITSDNLPNLKEKGFYGAPDLVIEILSPATWRFDKEDKKDVYEQCGVKEYWMIDPNDKSTDGYYLENKEFKSLPAEKGIIHIRLLDLAISF